MGRWSGAVAVAATAVAVAAGPAWSDPPGNDAQSAPVAVDATSSAVEGTTLGATVAKTDPTSPCNETVTATVWYSLVNVPSRPVVLRLTAYSGLDAVIAVYRVRNGRLSGVECDETDIDGIATIGFSAQTGDLILIGQTTGSPSGTFAFAALVPAPPEPVPGRALHGVARGSVEEFLNETDLWHANLHAGTTYRISFIVSPNACPSLRLYRPGGPPTDARQVLYVRCNGSASFTPGPNGGGRYLLLVDIAYAHGRVPYRIQVARAQPDDTAPGLNLPVGTWHPGRLNPMTTDQLDMYRFVLAERSDVTVQLGRPWAKHVSLLLLRDTGKSLAAGHAIRRPLAPGTYYVVVSAPTHTPATTYRVLLRERGVSTLTAPELQHGHIPLRTPLTLTALIGKPALSTATLEIDRFDPLQGWLFLHSYKLHVSDNTASFTWKPTHVGTYRARITAPSRSSYLYITIDDPIATP